jgi:hypothetical protein
MRHQAIYNTHPKAKSVHDNGGAFDIDGNAVEIDESLVAKEIVKLLAERARTAYIDLRAAEYPDFKLYLDGVVKGDQAQIQSYIDACQAVKAKYPKE